MLSCISDSTTSWSVMNMHSQWCLQIGVKHPMNFRYQSFSHRRIRDSFKRSHLMSTTSIPLRSNDARIIFGYIQFILLWPDVKAYFLVLSKVCLILSELWSASHVGFNRSTLHSVRKHHHHLNPAASQIWELFNKHLCWIVLTEDSADSIARLGHILHVPIQ